MGQAYLSNLISRQAKKYGDRVALKYRDYSKSAWIPVSFNEFADFVNRLARAFVAEGLRVQENIATFSQNKPECLYVDFASFATRTVTIPLYATSSESQVHYIVEDAEISHVFVGEQFQYDVAWRVQTHGKTLKQIVIFDKSVKRMPDDTSSIYFDEFLKKGDDKSLQAEVDKRTSESNTDDIANILYTSGTTGESKGVMLHHSCFNAAISAHDNLLTNVTDQDVVMNFLPYTHIFERAWTYFCIHKGCTLCVNLHPQDIQKSVKEIRPTAMCSVPRFWEKVYNGVMEKINETSGMKKKMMLDALEIGRKYNIEYVMNGKKPPMWLTLKYKLCENTVFSLLKKTIGIENGQFFPTAGAAIPIKVEEFTHSVGINMVAGYGLTETTATVSFAMFNNYQLGSVGNLLPGVEVKFGEDNEILVRGETITRGYYKKEALTKQAFTEDGWFRTGDAGYMKDGRLYLTERIKDLFKTSNGKYIAPQAIETKLVVDTYIDQISIIADRRKFVSALIVPDYAQVKKFAESHHIEYSSMEDLLKKSEIIELFRGRIDTLQQEFAHYEQIKRFTLLPKPFSMERGELTNTLKIKRAVLLKNYEAEIDKMYED